MSGSTRPSKSSMWNAVWLLLLTTAMKVVGAKEGKKFCLCVKLNHTLMICSVVCLCCHIIVVCPITTSTNALNDSVKAWAFGRILSTLG